MTIDYQTALTYQDTGQVFRYDDRDVMLYALGVGMGRDPLNADELPFVFEKRLKVLPSFAAVATPGAFKVRALGIDYAKVLHGEYAIEWHRPLPPAATIIVDVTVVGVWDKGADKGALVTMQAAARDQVSNLPIFTAHTGYFCRGNGGFMKPGEQAFNAPPEPHSVPDRPAEWITETQTRPEQPLLYRLCGDRNPLHADPEEARRVGFERPIFHGLCTYGVCCVAILKTFCNYYPDRMRSLALRFSQPVIPGETIIVEMWKDAEVVSFRAKVKERNVVVVNNGRCTLNGDAAE